jgi:cell wall-associated NlpC family hydrolase
VQYQVEVDLNLYDSTALERLATQAKPGRYLQLVDPSTDSANPAISPQAPLPVCLCEDDYPGWIAVEDRQHLQLATVPYQSKIFSQAEIQAKIPDAIAFAQAAMAHPNQYLWGGTLGPNYDCSGLIQTAFASVGLWLPRDAYQQEAFTQAIALTDLQPGDLVFFGPAHKATHVGLCLGNNQYLHSSGKDQGHNGIAIDVLSNKGSSIGQTYYAQLRGAGRIVAAYQSKTATPG